MNQTLKYCAISGIIALVLLIPAVVLEVLKSLDKSPPVLIIVQMVIFLLSGIFSALFLYGLLIVAKYFKLKFLHVCAFGLMVSSVLTTSYAIVAENTLRENAILAVVVLVLYGIVIFVVGIAFLKSKEVLGPPAKAIGILGIIIGSSFFTIILGFIGMMLLVPYEILNIILLLRIGKRIETEKMSAS